MATLEAMDISSLKAWSPFLRAARAKSQVVSLRSSDAFAAMSSFMRVHKLWLHRFARLVFFLSSVELGLAEVGPKHQQANDAEMMLFPGSIASLRQPGCRSCRFWITLVES